MWWLIGLGVAALLYYLFARFRVASHQAQLVEAGRDHLWHSFRSLKRGGPDFFEREIDERVWQDPYLLGYAQGSLAIMTEVYGRRLNTMQKGMVLVHVLRDMAGAPYQEICERLDTLNSRGNTEYKRGMVHGTNVAVLMADRAGPETLADPDVQKALRGAPEMERQAQSLLGPSEMGQSGAAGALLMQTYMKRHQEKAGY